MPIPLSTLDKGAVFAAPWRPENKRYGYVKHHGNGGTEVHVPVLGGTGMEDLYWSHATMVEPATQAEYLTQHKSNPNGVDRARSAIEKPVEVVHRLCREMRGAKRDEIVEAAVKLGVNISTAKTQYYAYQKLQKPVKG